MARIIALIKKEILSILNSPIIYIVTIGFVVVNSWLYFENFFVAEQATLRTYFAFFPWILLFLIPAISMRVWAEEKKSGTIEFLLTTATKDWEAVIAKYLSTLILILFILICTLPVPLSVAAIGNVDGGQIVTNYIAAFLLAASMVAIGQWLSSLSKNQIVSFIITLLVLFALMMIGLPYLLASTKGILTEGMRFLSTQTHFLNMSKGVIDIRDVTYFISIIVLFLFLNVFSLQSRHWK
ncbi:MAG: ABC transporter permease subunit [Candidatus Jacksonbacteria bacterium]|jgi:ABC-2 type transport system permease protein|nr:ABC transporter permease subunit [Candidatus Jacksonbacteria bacterium]MBT6033980.1 ABC transporter permease subunit [Candidatus Jacksonbacteria bacterium]MBT6300897.1 ABC transporter permease subunit [Candidatus Jacksonbacteria bacterium]MBT6757607.1 ABC transporter permease subunit [Candidatus Jacksonbacteria bacterium]MBT6955417.1 ABC transporter permease subunit [Candidatus Jacksonbacteria bacterium]